MKEQCILCYDDIDTNNYIKNGNFCLYCIARCGELSRLWPDNKPTAGTHNFKERMETYQLKKEAYDRMSKHFQDSLPRVKILSL